MEDSILEIGTKYFIKTSTDSKGNPIAQLYIKTPKGRYSKEKQIVGYRFGDEAKRDEWVIKQANKILETERQNIERKANRRSAAKEAVKNCTVEVGAIFANSWGYDQTNVDFYEVVAVSGQTLTMRALMQDSEEDGFMCGKCVPIPGKYFLEDIFKKRLQVCSDGTPYVAMDHGWCQLWDGKPKYYSSYA